eukprot:TRINITY_DN500_c1_g1_i1.p1 TRINITY_DN500_c1_g1~~TRINITY_DN500_c1_g1_i1.p1  ORF type:complete len:280 (-),score=43.33 TRINITY_DN500_c1_g1_i1:34-873(-)
MSYGYPLAAPAAYGSYGAAPVFGAPVVGAPVVGGSYRAAPIVGAPAAFPAAPAPFFASPYGAAPYGAPFGAPFASPYGAAPYGGPRGYGAGVRSDRGYPGEILYRAPVYDDRDPEYQRLAQPAPYASAPAPAPASVSAPAPAPTYASRAAPAPTRSTTADVTVVEVAGLPATSGGFIKKDKTDPYVQILVGSAQNVTRVAKDAGSAATYNQTFSFPIGTANSGIAHVYDADNEVKDKPNASDDRLGSTSFPLTNGSSWYDFTDSKGKNVGRVRLDVRLR